MQLRIIISSEVFNWLISWLCPPAQAHGNELAPASVPAWWEWHLEPELILLLSIVLVGYFHLSQRYRKDRPFPLKQSLLFFSGIFLFYAAVASPIDYIGEEFLFFVHMIQHTIFIYPVAILILIGLPEWLIQPVVEDPRIQPVLKKLLHPIVGCLAFGVTFSIWHVPFLYEMALKDQMVHNLEHFSFLITALMMWWPILTPVKSYKLHPGVQLLYILALTIAQLPSFFVLVVSAEVLYPTYALAERIMDLTPIGDQMMGAVVMKLCGMLVFSGAFLNAFLQWSKLEEGNTPNYKENIELINQVQPHYG